RLFPLYKPGQPSDILNQQTLGYGAWIRKQISQTQSLIDAGAETVSDTTHTLTPEKTAVLKAQVARARDLLRNFRVARVGVAGAILMVATQIASMVPTLPVPVRGALGAISLLLNIGLNVAIPIVTVVAQIKLILASGKDLLTAISKLETSMYGVVQRGAV